MKSKKSLKCALSVGTAVAVIATSVFCVYFVDGAKYKKMPLSLPGDFTVTAHTGSEGTKDNSVESILLASRCADIAEFDLNFTAEGTPVLSHDAPKTGVIDLQKAFEVLSEQKSLKANVDVKSTRNLSQVQQLALSCGVIERIFYTGVEQQDVEVVKKDSPLISYYLNVSVDKKKRNDDSYILSLVETVKRCGAVGINMNKDSASKRLVELFHENGLLVSIWTVNSKRDMYKILSFSPDNITTKNPTVLREIVGR